MLLCLVTPPEKDGYVKFHPLRSAAMGAGFPAGRLPDKPSRFLIATVAKSFQYLHVLNLPRFSDSKRDKYASGNASPSRFGRVVLVTLNIG